MMLHVWLSQGLSNIQISIVFRPGLENRLDCPNSRISGYTLKPIFHCDAKLLMLGVHVGHYPQDDNFALRIPTCWYLKMLKLLLPRTQNPNICITPNIEHRIWNIGLVGYPTRGADVDFMLFVSFLVVLGTQRKCDIQWNTRLMSFSVTDFISS